MWNTIKVFIFEFCTLSNGVIAKKKQKYAGLWEVWLAIFQEMWFVEKCDDTQQSKALKSSIYTHFKQCPVFQITMNIPITSVNSKHRKEQLM